MRPPIVGTGSDGYRRSAQVIRDELDTLAPDDPRRPFLEAEVVAWEERAAIAARLEDGDAVGSKIVVLAREELEEDDPRVRLLAEPGTDLALILRLERELDPGATFDDALEELAVLYRAAVNTVGQVVAAELHADGRRLRIPSSELERRFG